MTPATAPTPISMDVDTGVDDALAILFAVARPDLVLQTITTVDGNTDARQAARNTAYVLGQVGVADRVPIEVGHHAPRPTQDPNGEPSDATHVHGTDGLGGAGAAHWLDRPVPEFPEADLTGDPWPTSTLVATAPLTNLARVLTEKGGLGGVTSLLIMGGTVDPEPGNVTPHAEFNFWADPEAAAAVLAAPLPITLFPLNVTHRVVLAEADLRRRLDHTPATRRFLEHITGAYVAFHEAAQGFRGSYIHDLLPLAWLVEPAAFALESMPLRVVTSGERAGRVERAPAGSGPDARVAMEVDAARVLDLVWDAFEGLEPMIEGADA